MVNVRSILAVGGVLAIASVIFFVLFSSVGAAYFPDLLISIGIISAVIIVFTLARYYLPFRKLLGGEQREHFDYIKDDIQKSMKAGISMPASLDDEGNVLDMPDWDISLIIGDHHFWRFKDKTHKGNITRVLINDGTNKRIRGELRGEQVNSRPKEAVKEMVQILESVKLGEAPRIIPAAAYPVVKEVVEKETVVPNEEQKKKEEAQQKGK